MHTHFFFDQEFKRDKGIKISSIDLRKRSRQYEKEVDSIIKSSLMIGIFVEINK